MNFDFIFLNIFGLSCPWLWALGSLGAFLLGWLLDWLLSGRGKQLEINRLTTENNSIRGKLEGLEAEISSLKYKLQQADENVSSVRRDLIKCQSDKQVLQTKLDQAGTDGSTDILAASSAGAVASRGGGGGVGSALPYGRVFESDNLQIVEGIGPKIEGLLKDAGVLTWSALAACPVDRLQKVLDEAGPRYKMHNPKTWPEQAKLADQGNWEELVKYQKFLDSGRDNKGSMESPSKIEKMAMKILGFSNNPEDLKIVEGIGPKIEQLLKNAGVNNWAELANTPIDRLKSILADAGERYRLADPSTWPKQANLAAEGKWSDLNEYQEYLDGGKEPGK